MADKMNNIVITNCDYAADNNEDLSFNKGDKIIVWDENDNGIWRGKLQKNNNIGLFKIDYININHFNINKICFCGKPMKRHQTELKEWGCYCCCEIMNDKIYYQCGRWEKCEHKIRVGWVYQICYQCFNELDNDLNNDENKDRLEMRKIDSSIKIINKQ
eukprot:56169_1